MSTAEQIEFTKKALAFSSDNDLAHFLHTSAPTIRNWRQGNMGTRLSKQIFTFKAVHKVLEKLLSSGRRSSPQEIYNFFVTPRKTLDGQSIHQIILETATDDNAVKLIVFLTDASAKVVFAEKPLSANEEFEKSFGNISNESCRKAAEGSPSILLDLLKASRDPIEKSIILEAFSYSDEVSLVEHIITYLDDVSPLVRSSAVIALHAFAEDSDELSEQVIFPALRDRLEREPSDLIKKSMKEALSCHAFEF